MTQLVVYGSLRQGQKANRALRTANFAGEVRVPGYDLYDLTWFPGVKENPKNEEGFVGELYTNVDEATIRHLDAYEGYRPDDVARSLFRREEIEVNGEPTLLYVFNKDPFEAFGTSARVVRGGDWVKYKGEQ